jgi:hypothetical protein
MAFKKATKRDAILRFAIMGPAGSGKTRTALELATRLGKRVAVIDSEGGRSRAYSGRFNFDVDDELPDYSPESYVKAIRQAQTDGYDVIVVDSASHEWAGKGGVLAKVDNIAAKSQSGNKFTAWAVGTPAHQSFIDAVIQCRRHIILTLRSKTEWVLEENASGKKVPKAIGVGAVQRDGTEYEVDFVGQMDPEHRLTIIKTTDYAELEGVTFDKPSADLADALKKWLSDKPAPGPVATPEPKAAATNGHAAVQDAPPEAILAMINMAPDLPALDALVPTVQGAAGAGVRGS